MLSPSARDRLEAHLRLAGEASAIEAGIQQAFASLGQQPPASNICEEDLIGFANRHEELLLGQMNLLAAMQTALLGPQPATPSASLSIECNGHGGSIRMQQGTWNSSQDIPTLPHELMRVIVTLALDQWKDSKGDSNVNAGPPVAEIRLASRGLRDIYDSVNTHIILGGGMACLQMDGMPSRAGTEEDVTERIRGLLQRTPNLRDLSFKDSLPYPVDPPSGRCIEEVFLGMTMAQPNPRPLSALLPSLHSLTFRTLSSHPGLLHPLSSLSTLRHLVLNGSLVGDLSGLEGCTRLESLRCFGCTHLVRLASVPSLATLYIGCAEDLQDVLPLVGCTSLTNLSLGHCYKAEGLGTVLAALTNLKKLRLSECNRMESLDFLPALSGTLRSLELDSTYPLDVQGLRSCSNLEVLSLYAPVIHESQEAMEAVTSAITASRASLREISLCYFVLDAAVVQAAASCQGLIELHFLEWSDGVIVDLTPISNLSNLTALSLQGFFLEGSADLSFLTGLQGLTALILGGVSGQGLPKVWVTDSLLREVSQLQQLVSLELVNCRMLDLMSLVSEPGHCTLRSLALENCTHTHGLLPYLAESVHSLKSFTVKGAHGTAQDIYFC